MRASTVAICLPHDPSSVSEARHAVDDLDGALDDETVATVRLLVSELVTNSVRHGKADESGHIELSLSARGDTVRVEVADAGLGFAPKARSTDQDTGSGWGLHLVEALSHRWGSEQGGGTRIWFEIDGSVAGAGVLSVPGLNSR